MDDREDGTDESPSSTPVMLPESEAPPARPDMPAALDEYRIVELLGAGGMGRVYRARDTVLERDVAVKVLLRSDAWAHTRFLREARAAARLVHTNIASIHRFGTWEGQPYLVEEYVRGESLAVMATPVAWQRGLEIGLALARGLAAAHRRGVLHRDIKPANVILSEAGVPKLIDFGLAKLMGAGEPRAREACKEHGEHHPGAALGNDEALTDGDAIMGTSRYMAPEIWLGEAATPAADIYSLGVLLYEIVSGQTPFRDVPQGALWRAVVEHDAPALARVVKDVDARFAAIVDRCLMRKPEARFASADALRDALQALTWTGHGRGQPAGEPYRGLSPFDAEHRAFFFGRDRAIRDVLDRLRTEPWVLVTGESGVGKSSLVRAGVLPLVTEERFGGRVWQARTMVPGRRPLAVLAAELGQMLGVPEDALRDRMVSDAAEIGRQLREHHGATRGTVLFVDQLEELVTLSSPDEAAVVTSVLASLAERVPAMRVLGTVRGDTIMEMARLPGLGAFLDRGALYLLQPLGEDEIREAIVGPAEVKNVRFESPDMIDTLVASTLGARGGLPLLEFALSRIWEARDREHARIPGNALQRIGGVEGALSRHADGVLDALMPHTREAARRILIRLVTLRRTRARHTHDELTGGDADRSAALRALVEGRLVVACESLGQPAYEIAHEALITGWSTLRHWLDEQGNLRAIKEELARAAEEWERMGLVRDALWRGKRLREAAEVDRNDLSVREREFLRVSKRAERRDRWLRRMALLAPFIVGVCVYAGLEIRDEQELRQFVVEMLHKADASLGEAEDLYQRFMEARASAFADLRGGDMESGEREWHHAVELAPEVEARLADASGPIEHALRRAPGHGGARRRLLRVLDAQAHLAHVQGRDVEREQILQRLAVHDDTGERMRLWRAPLGVSLHTSPAGLAVRIESDGRRDAGQEIAIVHAEQRTPAEWQLAPGTYVLVVPATATTVEVRYPLALEPAAVTGKGVVALNIDVPLRSQIPTGFVYVAAGAFEYGYGRNRIVEPVREWHKALPEHERTTGPYLISDHETTHAEWIEFLRALSPKEREIRRPRALDDYGNAYVELVDHGNKFELRFRASKDHEYRAMEGEPFVYEVRNVRQEQDWLNFPVTGISGEDARAYTEWLDRTRRLPGARLCREDEWERAARGADARMFPHGDRLERDDANIDKTYGKNDLAYGPDEVGAHRLSRSPFGLDDMVGNAWEMTLPIDDNSLVLRSGAYYFSERMNAIVNREPMQWTQALPYAGFRVCADVLWRVGVSELSSD